MPDDVAAQTELALASIDACLSAAGAGPHLALLVHHDDATREFAYDRQSKLARLDKAWDEANTDGWTVVSMKDDWKTIYPGARQQAQPGDGRTEVNRTEVAR